MDLDDAAFAYQLQLQEACRASAQAAEIGCTTLSESSYPEEAVVNNQLQVHGLSVAFGVTASNSCSSGLSKISHPRHPLPVCSLQSAALREAAVSLSDAKQAQKLQRELQQRAAREVHDLHVAHWLDEVNDSDWDSHGDNLELPINPSSLQNNKLHAFCTWAAMCKGTGLAMQHHCRVHQVTLRDQFCASSLAQLVQSYSMV